MVNENMNQKAEISSEEINRCIDILERLISNSNQIFDIPEEQRIALIKASGKLSRPNKQEFIKWKKDAKKAEKVNALVVPIIPEIIWTVWCSK